MADQITIEFVGDFAKLSQASSKGMTRLVSDVRGAEADVGKSADKMSGRFEKAFDGIHARVGRKVGPGFVSLGGELGGKIAGGFAALGIGTVIAGQLGEALNIDAGVDKLEARLGLTAKEAERIGKIAGETYAGAWGESMEEVQGFYAETMRAFPKLTEEALQKVTESAATTSDVWDQDFNEVVRAAQNLFKNGLAPDAQTAMDIVATALQNTKGPQDEVLQSLIEYSDHFAVLGLDGKQVLGGLTSEFANNQFAIDKVGDAFKELGIRVLDGSDTTKEGLEDIGLSVGEVEGAFRKGGDTAKEMTERIVTGILGIKDPAERARAGVALMGTPFEDLGNNAVPVLEDVLTGVEDLTDTVETGNTAYDNAKTKIESWRRQGLQKLTEFIGGTVIPVLEDDFVPAIEDASGVISDETKNISAAAARYLGVEVPESAGKSWRAVATMEERNRRRLDDGVQGFRGFHRLIRDDTLTFGEKFGIVWRDIWADTTRSEQRNLNRMLNFFSGEWTDNFQASVAAWGRRVAAAFGRWMGSLFGDMKVRLFVLQLQWSIWTGDVMETLQGWATRLGRFFGGIPGRIIRNLGDVGKAIKDQFMKVLGDGLKIPINLIFGGDGLGIGALADGGGGLMGIPESATVARSYRAIGSPGDVISGARPGARTLSGNLSYHALFRALDFTPIRAVAQRIITLFGRRTRELISPWPELGIHNGRPHRFSDEVQAQHDGRTNVRHIHWAMRDGIAATFRQATRFVAGEAGGEDVVAVPHRFGGIERFLDKFGDGIGTRGASSSHVLNVNVAVNVAGSVVAEADLHERLAATAQQVMASSAVRSSLRAWKG